jgi:hypothetical protein
MCNFLSDLVNSRIVTPCEKGRGDGGRCFLGEGGVYERGTAEIASGQARLAVCNTKRGSDNFLHSNKLLPQRPSKTWFTIPFGLVPRLEQDHRLGYELLKRFSEVIVQRLDATQVQLLKLTKER